MSDRFCGFDLDRVAALRRAVADTAEPARRLSRAIGDTSDRATEAIARADGVSMRQLGVEPSMDTDPERAALRTISTQAPGVADEIGRRLAHLAACEQLEHHGFRVDPARVFDDAPPPDEARVRAAVNQLRAAVTNGDLWEALAALAAADDTVRALTAVETEAFVGQLNSRDLHGWNLLLSLHVFGVGVSESERVALANHLLSSLSGDSVRSLVDAMPVLEPSFADTDGADNDDQNDLHWRWADGGLLDGPPSPADLQQGDLGDCWFLAALGAEVARHPSFVRDHVRDNGNGTYTVTFYDDGKPVPVTVDGRLPYNGWDTTAFEHPTDNGNGAGQNGGRDNWVAIYEKAFAQFRGGYREIEGGYGSEGMQFLTGATSHKLAPDDLSPAQLKQHLDSGRPLTGGTGSHHSGFLWLNEDEFFDQNKLVTKHEYVITAVDTDASPPTVTVRNSWGETGSVPEVVTLSWDEFRDHFDEVSVGG